MTVLSIGNILNAGFDQIFNLYSASVYSTGVLLYTCLPPGSCESAIFAFRHSRLFKSVVSGILIVASYKLADKFAGYRVF